MQRDEDRLAGLPRRSRKCRESEVPNRGRGWKAARRAAGRAGLPASARAVRTRARSPVDRRFTGRSASASSSNRAISSSIRCVVGAVEAERDHVARGDRPGDVPGGGEEGEQPAAPGRRRRVDVLAIDGHHAGCAARSGPVREAGWSCRRRSARPGRPARPARTLEVGRLKAGRSSATSRAHRVTSCRHPPPHGHAPARGRAAFRTGR